MRKILKHLLSVTFGVCLMSASASASKPNFEDAENRLQTFIDMNNRTHFTALVKSLKDLPEDSIQKLDQKKLQQATANVIGRIPACLCPLEDIDCMFNPDRYRNILLYMSYVKPTFQKDAHETMDMRVALKLLLNIYYREGKMDGEMVKAFTTLNQHYHLDLNCKTLYQIWRELSFQDKLTEGIIAGPILGFCKVIATPTYRNLALGAIGTGMAIFYLVY